VTFLDPTRDAVHHLVTCGQYPNICSNEIFIVGVSQNR